MEDETGLAYLDVCFEGLRDALRAADQLPVLVQRNRHWNSIKGEVLNIVRVEHLTIY